jgi:hypothetical protein
VVFGGIFACFVDLLHQFLLTAVLTWQFFVGKLYQNLIEIDVTTVMYS